MNRLGLALLLVAAWFAVPAAAAPAPAPPSDGPISDALALRASLPRTAPPLASSAFIPEEGQIELQRQVMQYMETAVKEVVTLPDGKKQEVVRTVASVVFVPVTFRVKTDALKFYTVSKDGKLEALDAAKAKGMLKNSTPVLTGDSADVDPRSLELIRPGTLFLLLPPPQAEPIPQRPDPPGAKP